MRQYLALHIYSGGVDLHVCVAVCVDGYWTGMVWVIGSGVRRTDWIIGGPSVGVDQE